MPPQKGPTSAPLEQQQQPENKQYIPSYAPKFVTGVQRSRLRHIFAPHVDSFNFLVDHGLEESIADMPPLEFGLDQKHYIKFKFLNAELGYPVRSGDDQEKIVTPREAREAAATYAAPLTGNIQVSIEGPQAGDFIIPVKMGNLPIMVKSNRCHLYDLPPQKLVNLREEANEMGGYFILNGIERVIRLLQVQRRNFPLAIERSSYKNRGSNYTDKGVAMRCTRPDQTSVTVTLHYLSNGGATLRFVLRKQEFLLPVVLVAKALLNISDQELFNRIVGGDYENTFMTTRLELLLRDFKSYKLNTPTECRAYIGSLFRGSLPLSDRADDATCGAFLIERYIFVHTKSFSEKLDCLILMIRKLFSFVQGRCISDNADALMNHEILLPGHLISMYIKEKMEESLLGMKQTLTRDYRMNKSKFESEYLSNNKYYMKQFERLTGSIGNKIGSFLSTGNIVSSTGMDLMQVSGYTVVSERLNYFRYLSHFQGVHRGQFFTTMKTTTVRKLLPESWGFLCPVHTPDGGPCGLLNHMAKEAVVLTYPSAKRPAWSNTEIIPQPSGVSAALLTSPQYLQEALCYYGMKAAGIGSSDGSLVLDNKLLPVLCDGVLIGGVHVESAYNFVQELKNNRSISLSYSKGENVEKPVYLFEPTTEIAYFPRTDHPGPYPGIFLFTQAGRLVRPVMNLTTRSTEWIGPMEQVFMEIACVKEDIRSFPQIQNATYNNSTTHMELSPTAMLSQIASLTPFSDYNQSPRNMYQCQMGKQTMGTPAHALKHRADNKLYRIQNVQAPLVQTEGLGEYCMDEYPHGCNAVVAVISYTGYDMEDAMIINKGAYERGFGHGSMYKTKVIGLDDEEKRLSTATSRSVLKFSNLKLSAETNEYETICEELDTDGLPHEGVQINYGDPICCMVDVNTGESQIIRHKDNEPCFVETVRVIGSETITPVKKDGKTNLRKVSITFRYRRNPIIGDKFSSRHGQKGTLSVLWPQENMPFTESGMSPDVLINPHAFPSRMTIGMLIESMAGKACAIHGTFQDATPFQFHEKNRVIDYVGDQLKSCGYQYYGSEPLYNGHSGQLMQADIFIGLVFYQRLRHMVSDKSQVRSTGPVTAITRQPVKGRKKHGGIRLGEMERDALLSHGVSFCLQDRLMNCSDSHLAHICIKCGSLLSVYAQPTHSGSVSQSSALAAANTAVSGSVIKANLHQCCASCKTSTYVRPVNLPYVFRYLSNELAGMGIKLSLDIRD